MLWFGLALLAAFVGGALGSVAWRVSGRRRVQGAVAYLLGVPALLWAVAAMATPPWE